MTRARALAAVLLLAGVQTDPLETFRRELGAAFLCERIDAGVILASDAGEVHKETLRACLRKSMAALREHAFVPAPSDTLLVLAFKDTGAFRAYTARHYPEAFEVPVFHDVVQRRLLVHAEIGSAFAPASLMSFQLGQHLGIPILPPWADAALSALDEDPLSTTSIFDSHAALLRGALRRGAVPALRDLLRMPPPLFRSSGLHVAVVRKLTLHLKAQGRLRSFFAELRRTPDGLQALEATLGKGVPEIEEDFTAHLRDLPWLREDKFRDFARKGFGPAVSFRRDDELFLAVAGDVDEASAIRAIDEVRRLHGPLLRHLELRTSGLPLLVRLFKDEASFQDFASFESTERGWITGYYLPIARSISVTLSAGVGALTHEVCHSLFEDDLGALPPWANEGLAALYEKFRIEQDLPRGEGGFTLPALREALGAGRVPSLGAFLAMNGKLFWDKRDRDVHYVLARALFLHLQDTGGLLRFIQTLQKARRAKPSTPLSPAICREAFESASGLPLAPYEERFRHWVAASR